jgi:hypothetical protein
LKNEPPETNKAKQKTEQTETQTSTNTMVEKRIRCDACDSVSAPEGAKFCPNCGVDLVSDDDNHRHDGVPMAAAVRIEDDIPVSASASASASHNFAPLEDSVLTDATGATAAAAAHHHHPAAAETEGALFWKNPSPALLERATSITEGGVLFIQTPNYTKGKFVLAKSLNVGHILSGTKIDLSRADFVHPVSTIYAGTILGGIEVIVPRGVRVETSGIGILGGFKGMRSQTVNAGQDAPLVVIKGLAILGGVNVVVNDDVPPVRIVAH